MAPRSNPTAAPSIPSAPESPSAPETTPTITGPLTFATPSPSPDPSDLPEHWLSDDVSDEAPPAPSAASPTSSRGSSGNALSKAALRETVRSAVLMAGAIANQFLARQDDEREAGLYLADETDAEGIGDPLANIAHRHGGLGQAGNPDVVDAIAALIAAGSYVYKQIALARAIKINRRNVAPQEPQDGRSQDGEGDWSYPVGTGPLAASAGAAGIS